MVELEKVLKYLKKNKSRDPLGLANEIFRDEVAGKDLKCAILKMVNRIKEEQTYPKILEKCNISSIYKNKKSRNNFENYRGIFRVPIFRTILDRLIFNDEYDTIDDDLTDSNVGARRRRNIRDNIFVLNAITNSVSKGTDVAIDIQIFDIEKCFDSLWMEECINDLYETGFANDKLSLLFLENQNAQIAIKTSQGITKRKSITNAVMQGTVWSSLFCTTTMDKLGKIFYKNKEFLYKYRNKIEIPSLGMVDDILSVQKCSIDASKANAVINAFVDSKKLILNKNKCHRIHIGPKNRVKNRNYGCPDLKVHNAKMSDSKKEKYLGDVIDNTGKNRETVNERQRKGYAIVAEILAILDDIPLGKHKMEIGLHLRQAMLLNGMLYNSEVWHALGNEEIKILEKVDEHLLRMLVKAHSKTAIEFLYLEAGAIPIRFLISCRRVLYLQTVLQRPENELTRRVYMAQTEDVLPGDFYQLVQQDLQVLGGGISDRYIQETSRSSFKKEIKMKIRSAAFEYLKMLQSKHTKIKNIQYSKFETQSYLTSPMFSNKEVNLLHALRSRSVNVKCNFSSKYKDNLSCPVCLVESESDDQQHILNCTILNKKLRTKITANNRVAYSDIFGDVLKQKEVTYLYMQLLTIREELLDKNLCWRTAPSNSDTFELLEISDNLQPCTVRWSSGIQK